MFERLLMYIENNNISHRNDHFKQECCVKLVRNWLGFHGVFSCLVFRQQVLQPALVVSGRL